MATIYPLARVEFFPEPMVDFLSDDYSVLCSDDSVMISMIADPEVIFDYAPFEFAVSVIDPNAIYDEDTGQVLSNEDTGQTLFAEEAT